MRKASGARTRISTFCAGIFLFLLVVVFGDFVGTIPMVVLVAVMIVVAIVAFDWYSVRPSMLKRMPKSEAFVMVATVVLVLIKHDLAVGIVGGGAGLVGGGQLRGRARARRRNRSSSHRIL